MVQPGAPPAKAAVGDDMMPAAAHEMKVFISVEGVVVIDKSDWEFRQQVLLCPGYLVGKDEKLDVAGLLGDEAKGPAIILGAAKTMIAVGLCIVGVVAAADMNADGVDRCDLPRKGFRGRRKRCADGQFPPDDILEVAEITFALPVSFENSI